MPILEVAKEGITVISVPKIGNPFVYGYVPNGDEEQAQRLASMVTGRAIIVRGEK